LINLKTVHPGFSDTLDELVDVTKLRINNSLELLWAITQQQSVVPKIKASIESVQVPSFCGAACDCADICIGLARKVRFEVYFDCVFIKSKDTGGVCRQVSNLVETRYKNGLT
jgi:hypothetical protein